MKKEKTCKLSIYLIKSEINKLKDIIKDDVDIKTIEIEKGKKNVFYKESTKKKPNYIERFFLNEKTLCKLYNSSSQIVFICRIEINKKKYRYFAIPFGVGFHLLNQGVIEERFGLRIVLNNVKDNMLRSIDKKNLSTIPKQAREQIGTNSEISEFGVDIEQDLILGVTGKTSVEEYGNMISGKDAFSLSVNKNMDSIDDLLKDTYSQYMSDKYKEKFGWIDQIKEVKSKDEALRLFQNVIERIKRKDIDKIWMAIPEIIDWEDVDGFNYSFKKWNDLSDDISLNDVLSQLFPDGDYSTLKIEHFKKNKVICYGRESQSVIKEWRILSCIYCEETDTSGTYILSNGKWYNIESTFVDDINKEYNDLLQKKSKVILPICNYSNEDEYNREVAASSMGVYALMDRKNIPYGGGYSKIEFCDLYSKERIMIHIKNYGQSAVLSHLFNQGLVSGELLRSDIKFVELVNKELPQSHIIPTSQRIQPNEYKVVYGIISHSKKGLSIPFFSKVSLRNVKRRLESLGYEVYLQKIEFDGSQIPKKKRIKTKRKAKKRQP